MKILKVITLILLASSFARANEDEWVQTTLTLPKIANEVSGYVTDKGTFRITEARDGLSEIKISGGLFKADPKKAEVRCKGYGKSLRTAKDVLKNTYRLQGFIYPFAKTEIDAQQMLIENAPKISVVEVNLVPLVADPIVTAQAKLDLQESIKNGILANLKTVQQSGVLTLDLFQADDLACDLILGNLELEIRFGLNLEIAKHIRQPIITPDEFGFVFENVKNKKVFAKESPQVHFVNGAHLHQALLKEINKTITEFGEEQFLKLSGALYDSKTGVLKNLTSSQYKSSARSLDSLKRYQTLLPYSQKLKATSSEKL